MGRFEPEHDTIEVAPGVAVVVGALVPGVRSVGVGELLPPLW